MKKQNTKEDNERYTKTAGRIAHWMLQRQEGFARGMDRQYSKLGLRSRKTALVLFCFLFGGISIYCIVKAVAGNRYTTPTPPGSFYIPRQNNPREEETTHEFLIDEGTLKRVEAFRMYMDSLRKTHNPEYSRMMRERPGLMDSIRQLETIYEQQKNEIK